MEHPEDNLSNPNDELMKRRFGARESFGAENEEEKKKRDEKKKREQAERRRREEAERKKQAEQQDEEPSWLDSDRPAADARREGFFGALLSDADKEADAKKANESTEDKAESTTEDSATIEARAVEQQAKTEAEAQSSQPEAESTEQTELDPSEKAEAAKAYIQERLKQLDEVDEDEPRKTAEVIDDTAESSAEVDESTPVKRFLHRLQERLNGGDPTALEDDQLDSMAAEAAQDEIDIEPSLDSVHTDTESPGAEIDQDTLTYEDIDSAPEEDPDTDTAETDIDDDDTLTTTPSSVVQPSAAGTGGGSSSPPPPSSPPLTPPSTPPPSSSGSGAGGGTPAAAVPFAGADGGDTAPNSLRPAGNATAETATTGFVNEVKRGARSGGEFLLGAFVGYFIGRRRGRSQAEAELAPQQKKIEKELRDVQSSIEQREQKLTVVSEQPKPEGQPVVTPETRETRTPQPATEAKQAEEVVRPEPSTSEVPRQQEASLQPESTTESSAEQAAPAERSVPQPEHAPSAPPAPEILAAATVRSVVETAPEATPQPKRPEMAKQQEAKTVASVETMPRAELLQQADTVSFRGESLRDMYEADKVDEATVREVLRLEARGQSYERLLMRRVAEYEMARASMTGEQVLEPHAEQHAPDINNHNAQQPAPVFADTSSMSQSDAGYVGDTAAPPSSGSPPDNTSSTNMPEADNQTSVAPQVAIGVALGVVFVIVLLLFFA